jgi:hypothetical protein
VAVSPAAGAQCSGFSDVAASNTLCPSVDWLRNRSVTLGCSSTTLFCPNDFVIRLAMAAFMNRLGNALTPGFAVQQGQGASLSLPSPTVVCATADVAAAPYPRSASVIGVVNALANGSANLSMHMVYSTNAGGTWTSVTQAPVALGGSGYLNGAVQKSAIPLAAGTAYRFGVRLDPLPGTSQVGTWSCQLKSKVASRTGSAAPY